MSSKIKDFFYTDATPTSPVPVQYRTKTSFVLGIIAIVLNIPTTFAIVSSFSVPMAGILLTMTFWPSLIATILNIIGIAYHKTAIFPRISLALNVMPLAIYAILFTLLGIAALVSIISRS